MKAFVVEKTQYDATRPYAVVATFRRFNQVVGRYPDEAQAKRRARDLNSKMEHADIHAGSGLLPARIIPG